MPIVITAPTTAEEAIAWALAHLESFELEVFFRDWQSGGSLDGWVKSVREQEEEAAEFAAIAAA